MSTIHSRRVMAESVAVKGHPRILNSHRPGSVAEANVAPLSLAYTRHRRRVHRLPVSLRTPNHRRCTGSAIRRPARHARLAPMTDARTSRTQAERYVFGPWFGRALRIAMYPGTGLPTPTVMCLRGTTMTHPESIATVSLTPQSPSRRLALPPGVRIAAAPSRPPTPIGPGRVLSEGSSGGTAHVRRRAACALAPHTAVGAGAWRDHPDPARRRRSTPATARACRRPASPPPTWLHRRDATPTEGTDRGRLTDAWQRIDLDPSCPLVCHSRTGVGGCRNPWV